MQKVYLSLCLLGALALIPSCSQYGAQETYRQDQIGMTQEVKTGVIQSITPVIINADNNNAGTLIGAGAGALAGSTIGGGHGKTFSTAGFGVLGALAGSQIDKAVNQQDGLRIVVKVQNEKNPISVTQPKGRTQLYVGQQVNIYVGYKGSFVEPAY